MPNAKIVARTKTKHRLTLLGDKPHLAIHQQSLHIRMANPHVGTRFNKPPEVPYILLREKSLLPQLIFRFLLKLKEAQLLLTWLLCRHIDFHQRRIHMLRLKLTRLPNPLQTLPLTPRLLRTIQKCIRRASSGSGSRVRALSLNIFTYSCSRASISASLGSSCPVSAKKRWNPAWKRSLLLFTILAPLLYSYHNDAFSTISTEACRFPCDWEKTQIF